MKIKLLLLLMFILVLSSFASATLNNHTKINSTVDTDTRSSGIKFIANENFNLKYVYMYFGVEATRAYVLNAVADGNPLGVPIATTTTLTGTKFTFAGDGVAITKGSEYFVMLDKQGASWSGGYIAFTPPIVNTSLNWTNGLINNSGNVFFVARLYNVQTIESANPTPSISSFQYPNYTYNETYNNYNGWINLTTNQPTNCVSSNTSWNDIVNDSLTHRLYNPYYATIPDGAYNYTVTCNNSNGTVSAVIYFRLDTATPTITVNASFGIFIKKNTNYSVQFNFSDNMDLWGWNVTMNSVLVNYTSNIQTTTGQYIFTNWSWVTGQNNITAWVADGHTLSSIEDKVLLKVSDGLKVDNTKLTSLIPLESITYIKKVDRYNFCFYYDKPQTTVQLKMPSDCYYQTNSKYLGHFVCKNDLQWWDFENVDDFKISVDGKTNIITVNSDKETERFCFNSVGSLNTYQANYSLWGWGAGAEYPNANIELSSNTFKLVINSSNTSYTSSASLIYNNTVYPTIETIGTNYRNYSATITLPSVTSNANITWYFNYTFNGVYYNTTQTNQTVWNVNITNCSNAQHVQSVNFTFYNTTGTINSIVNASMTGNVITDNYGSFNITWGSNTSDAICFFPNTTSTVVETQFQYIVPGCGTRTYYLDTTLTNSTQYINLYCDSGTSQVTFNVKDENDDVVPNVFIYIQKYDVGTATATTNEIVKTDSNGQAVGNIIKNTQYYKFILVYGGVVVLDTSETLILLDEYTFRITLGGSTYFEDYDNAFNVYCPAITYTNATTSFSYTWADPVNNVTEGCLEVYLTSNTAHYLVNSTCSSASSGTVTSTLSPPYSSNSYLATGYVYINGQKFVCGDGASATFDVGWKDYGTESLFLSFLLIVFLITVGLWNPVVAIALMMVGIFLLNILGLFHLDWSWLVGFILLGGIVMWKMRQN